MTADSTITVKITLNTAELELPAGATLGDALSALDIPQERPKLMMLNSRMEKPDKVLTAGDEITAMPPLRGG